MSPSKLLAMASLLAAIGRDKLAEECRLLAAKLTKEQEAIAT